METPFWHLLHLVSVSFAVDLAYVALDPFRYTAKALTKLKEAEYRVTLTLSQKGVSGETALLELQDKKQAIEKDGFGPCVLHRQMFGTEKVRGWDIDVIVILLILIYISLAMISMHPDLEFPLLFIAIAILSFMGTLTPALFIRKGAQCMKELDQFIAKTEKLVDRAYEQSISKFERYVGTSTQQGETPTISADPPNHKKKKPKKKKE